MIDDVSDGLNLCILLKRHFFYKIESNQNLDFFKTRIKTFQQFKIA